MEVELREPKPVPTRDSGATSEASACYTTMPPKVLRFDY